MFQIRSAVALSIERSIASIGHYYGNVVVFQIKSTLAVELVVGYHPDSRCTALLDGFINIAHIGGAPQEVESFRNARCTHQGGQGCQATF